MPGEGRSSGCNEADATTPNLMGDLQIAIWHFVGDDWNRGLTIWREQPSRLWKRSP